MIMKMKMENPRKMEKKKRQDNLKCLRSLLIKELMIWLNQLPTKHSTLPEEVLLNNINWLFLQCLHSELWPDRRNLILMKLQLLLRKKLLWRSHTNQSLLNSFQKQHGQQWKDLKTSRSLSISSIKWKVSLIFGENGMLMKGPNLLSSLKVLKTFLSSIELFYLEQWDLIGLQMLWQSLWPKIWA